MRRQQRISVAVATNPRTKTNHLADFVVPQLGAVDRPKRFRELRIHFRQRLKQGHRVVIQAHADLVYHPGLFHAHFVGLPQRSNFRQDQCFQIYRVRFGQGQAIQIFQMLGDPPASHQHRAPRHFGGMRGKNRHDFYFLQRGQRVGGGNSRVTHAQQGPAKRSGQRRLTGVQFRRAAAALAVIGFSQIGQFEINRERFGHAIRVVQFHFPNDITGVRHQRIFRGCRGAGIFFTLLDQKPPQFLHFFQ